MNELNCRFCQSERINKAGFASNNGQQRYYCRHCRRKFRSFPESKVKSAADTPLIGPRPVRADLPSRGQLILQLRALAQKLGRSPRLSEITLLARDHQAFSRRAYLTVFGGFQAALIAARLPLATNQPVDPEDLINEVNNLQRKLRKRLVAGDVAAARRRGEVSSLAKYVRAFGSDAAAIRAAGVHWIRPPARRDLIKELQSLAHALGRAPLARDVQEAARKRRVSGYQTFRRAFGGIRAARRAAGLDTADLKVNLPPTGSAKFVPPPALIRIRKRVTEVLPDLSEQTIEEKKLQKSPAREKILQSLRELGNRLGRRPLTREVKAAGQRDARCPSAHHLAVEFGSIGAALEAAGLTNHDQPRKGRRLTDQEILASLKNLRDILGRIPTEHEVKAASKRGECVSINTVTRRFRSLGEAFR